MSAWDSQMFAVDSFGPFIGVFYQGLHLRHTFIYVRLGFTLEKTLTVLLVATVVYTGFGVHVRKFEDSFRS